MSEVCSPVYRCFPPLPTICGMCSQTDKAKCPFRDLETPVTHIDIDNVTLKEIDEEYEQTLQKLERLAKLREAIAAQDHRAVEKRLAAYREEKRRTQSGAGDSGQHLDETTPG